MKIIIVLKNEKTKIFENCKGFARYEETTGIWKENGETYTFKNSEIEKIEITEKETK